MGNLLEKAPHHIVILRALHLGDLLCSVPALRTLRAAFPGARIALVGLPWAASFVRRFSHYLDELIEFPGWPGLLEQEPQVGTIPAFLQQMQARHFDLALQMQGSGLLSNSLIALFDARQTAGYSLPGYYRPDRRLFFPYPAGQPEIRIFLQLMEHLGIPSQGEQLEFPVMEEEHGEYETFRTAYGLEPGRYICLHPGARFSGRRLPPALFAEVGDALARQGFRIVITGTATESEVTGAVAGHMQSPALDAAGLTSLGALALLLERAALLVSNDTGVSHIAAAVQTPSVILFTTSDPQRWRPLNHSLHRMIQNAGRASPVDILAEASALLSSKKAARIEPPTGAYASKSV